MLYIGADHRGFQLKEKTKEWLREWGYEFEDVGNEKYEEEDDYPDYTIRVAEGIVGGEGRGQPSTTCLPARQGLPPVKGILICGSGVGMSIAANRVAGVRCGLCTSIEQTIAARREDDINCLALGADYLSEDKAKQIVEAFLGTEFGGEERYVRRINKLT